MATPNNLAGFLANFCPPVATSARAALARLQKNLPGAIELAYDNYNALSIGFSPSDKTSESIFLDRRLFPMGQFLFPAGRETAKPEEAAKRHLTIKSVSAKQRPRRPN